MNLLILFSQIEPAVGEDFKFFNQFSMFYSSYSLSLLKVFLKKKILSHLRCSTHKNVKNITNLKLTISVNFHMLLIFFITATEIPGSRVIENDL